jgi:CRP/FNR family transcriptional regulator
VLFANVLAGLPDQLSSLLFAASSRRRLEAGQTLFDAGDPGDGCYRLEQGLLKVAMSSPQGEVRIIAMLGAGAIVGELSMIDGLPRSAAVIAIRDCALQFVSRKAFEDCTKAHPEICRHLMATLAMRLREADEALAAATFLTVKGRVARALIDLAKHIGQDSGAGRIVLGHKISQGELAAMAGVARENVSRTLGEWRKRKLVTQSSLYICVNDIAALRQEMNFSA